MDWDDADVIRPEKEQSKTEQPIFLFSLFSILK